MSRKRNHLELAGELARIATEAVYIVDLEDREFSASELVNAHSLDLPVYVANLHFADEEAYFAVHSNERNYASTLIRQLHARTTYPAPTKGAA